MIHGRYVLDLHCDDPDCAKRGIWRSVVIGYFTGATVGEAHKKARAAGWKVLVSKGTAICKDCKVVKA